MKIGALGQLQEWQQDWDAGAPEQQHRHVSHLYGLHPSNQITKRTTPDLFKAALKTLEMRGDDGTGWSLAWKINFWARLETALAPTSSSPTCSRPITPPEPVRPAPAVPDRRQLRATAA